MIGRAAQGKPWLCGQIATYLDTGVTPPEPTLEEQLAIMQDHITALHDFYGEYMGLRIARKHVSWYLQDNANHLQHRRAFNKLEQASEQLYYLRQMTETYPYQNTMQKEQAA